MMDVVAQLKDELLLQTERAQQLQARVRELESQLQAANQPDASVWATSTDLPGDINERKVYFVLIRDGSREINVAVTHKPKFNEVHADMYVTPDYSYTIHDGCDHENDFCITDDPDFEENWYGPQPGTIYQEVRKEEKP